MEARFVACFALVLAACLNSAGNGSLMSMYPQWGERQRGCSGEKWRCSYDWTWMGLVSCGVCVIAERIVNGH